MYIADTWNLKPKRQVTVEQNHPHGWFIWRDSDSDEDDAISHEYLHKDGFWYDSMFSNGKHHYHGSEQSAIDFAKQCGYEVT